MKALVTGAGGTVGARLCEDLERWGVEVVRWPRERVPVDDYWAMEHFVRSVAPDVLFHLATASRPTGRANESWFITYEWTSELAWICRQVGVRFVFASTAMVFSDHAPGPFTVDSVPDASEGYGYEKRRAEERVFQQNPEARVVRLGWQIDEHPSGNNMLAALEAQARERGWVEASTRWFPACSFLDDTVRALQALAWAEPGLYLLDANERWSFHDIVRALNARRGGSWRVEPTEHFVFDQRMMDDRVVLPSLQKRLPDLP
ncbi:sugar nucleotide-binding protein [Melittangium boletus]|uniref:dTDP-4-dehydrorhamnose reductase n=1 Tax=Melittangium boletus DSM 14713 TaxID=1294270 RepID=A0A250I659_9BACT|nr:sugar nucleotide-binding protein [Melittangium boletus]ATB27339.1 dTDP-6-deoxy-3,4-keto-hexulose reductase [Melittangium boletus DSM 14713]